MVRLLLASMLGFTTAFAPRSQCAPRRRTRRDVSGGEVPAAVSLLAGMFGGSIGVGAAYPLDTVKVKMQAYNARAGGSLTVARAGAVEVVRRVLAEEGVGGFYSGCSSTMVGQAFIKGTAFLVYDVSKNYFPPTALGLYLAACVSGLAASFVVTPVERVKVVMQARAPGDFAGPVACAREIVRCDGVDGLLTRGLGATLLREVPSYGFYFGAYEFATVALAPFLPAPLLPLVGGAAAGAAAWIPVYPVDVVKTALQTETGDATDGASFLGVARRLWKQGGPAIFWDGISPKLARAVLNHGVTFFVADQVLAAWTAL